MGGNMLTEEQQESLNKFITEVVFKECWHEIDLIRTCIKCKEVMFDTKYMYNYCTSWNAFGRLLVKLREDENGKTFVRFRIYLIKTIEDSDLIEDFWAYINPQTFAEAVARFYGWREE
jgi:peptide methionine sulfoxide reductase MsrB